MKMWTQTDSILSEEPNRQPEILVEDFSGDINGSLEKPLRFFLRTAYTSDELAHQLQDSSSRLLVTELSLLPIALIAAAKSGIPQSRILLLGEILDQDAIVSHSLVSILVLRAQGRLKPE
jgi:hypothetical protein